MTSVDPIELKPVRTERLILRPFGEADRAAYIRMHETFAGHLRRWTPSRPPEESLEQFFERQHQRARDGLAAGTGVRTVAIDAASGALVGCFNLNNINRGAAQYADAGWHVAVESIGRGYATEGVGALLDIAFAALNLHRVQANVIPENGASLRVAQKCGFRVEGLARAMIRINGEWADHVLHAKLASEHQVKYVL